VIYLGVYSENLRAIKFYNRFGFERAGEYYFEVGDCRDFEFIFREAVVDIYVGGDGGTWSCSDSVLYRIPTEIFDYNMLLNRLNTKEDLDLLISEQMRGESSYSSNDSPLTDIWVAHSGLWSGSPCIKFSLPADIFSHLHTGNTEETIGKLQTQQDLIELLIRSRSEMLEGRVSEAGIMRDSCITFSNIEVKTCGHQCTISSVKSGCCSCCDTRPIDRNGKYPTYRDGLGWVNEATRYAGYCPHCQKSCSALSNYADASS
jgi:hypothetical protein